MKIDHAAFARLPISTQPWEVDIFDAPVAVEGEDLEGLLIVAEAATGQIRLAVPLRRGERLAAHLHAALFAPVGELVPMRPRVVHCRNKATQRRVAEAWGHLGIEVHAVGALPAIDAATRAMTEALGGTDGVPGITDDVPAWRKALSRLVGVAPWEALNDGVTFRFEGGPKGLAEGVGILIGLAGEQEGVVLFTSEEAYRTFCARLGHGDAMMHTEALTLHLYPSSEVSVPERAACVEQGLALPGDRFPCVFLLDHGAAVPLSESRQAILLTAVEAICGLCEIDPEAPASRDCSARVATRHGAVVVRSHPTRRLAAPRERPLAQRYSHTLALTEIIDRSVPTPRTEPALVVKLAKRDAVALASQLTHVDRLVVSSSEDETTFSVGVGSNRLVPLAAVPRVPDAQLRATWKGERAWIVVNAGGAKRTTVRVDDAIFARAVSLEVSESNAGTAVSPPAASGAVSTTRRFDPLFNGPPETWPKASETLLRFLEPVLGGGNPTKSQLTQLADLGSMVWNAVVLADFTGQGQLLVDLRHRARSEPMFFAVFEMLMHRKRSDFGGDPRLLRVDSVEVRRGTPYVKVSAVWPEGLPRT